MAYFGKTKKKGIDLIREIILPACVLFAVILFVFMLGAMSAGVNVTETKTFITEIYDGETGNTTVDASAPSGYAMPVQLLLGMFIFSIAFFALKLVFRSDYSKIFKLFVHFLGTTFAFYLFILVLSGFVSNGNFVVSLFAAIVYGVVYFLIYGIIVLIGKLFPGGIPQTKVLGFLKMQVPKVFAVFTVILFSLTLYSLIMGELFDLKVVVRINENKEWLDDRVQKTTYTTLITPLAPTLQNYLRYLASSIVIIGSFFVFSLKLNKAICALLNFLILFAGYSLIWLVSLEYFYGQSNVLIVAITVFAAVYIVLLAAVSVTLFVKKRKKEKNQDYENQFLPGKS